MNLDRRQLLGGALASLAYVSLWGMRGAGAKVREEPEHSIKIYCMFGAGSEWEVKEIGSRYLFSKEIASFQLGRELNFGPPRTNAEG